jgi:branched-chain amino acid transport system substrate-binding protein
MQRGTELAVRQLAAAGAIDFDVQYKDHKSGDPQAGAAVMRELAADGVHQALTSYIAALGSQLPVIASSKILTIDGAGGTGTFGQSSPFFYGARAVIPDDTLSGMFQWLEASQPEARTISHVTWDVGPDDQTLANTTAAIEDAGFVSADAIKSAPGADDYSSVISALSSSDPDVVLLSVLDGLDISKFLKQYRTRGGDAIVVATANYDAASFDEVADANAKKDFYFTYDFFAPTEVTSDFAQFFVDSYQAEYGELPNELAANFYEDTLIQWELVRRTLAAGGSATDADELVAALEEDPSFVSVYGGEGATPGRIGFDLETHSVSIRPVGIFSAGEDGSIVVQATFDVAGENFQLVAG